MRKHSHHIFRTIRKGRIKWDNRYWKTRGNVSHIEGKRLVFGTYAPEYKLLCLWGTIAFYKYPDPDDEIGAELWREICEMMGVKVNKNPLSSDFPGGNYFIDNDEEGYVAYESRGIDWWHEDDQE